MANEIQLAAQSKLGNLPAKLQAKLQQGAKLNEALSAGITGGFAIVSVRGKVWRIKYQGEEKPLLNPDRSPRATIDVVIVKASPSIAKVFYEAGYEEGSNSPPDCWSVNGIQPDNASPKKQSPTCAGCPQNAWGSASRGGRPSKGKACADTKRLAIVPATDIANTLYGGPMLTRVPPASLNGLRQYAEQLAAMGFMAEGVVTRIGFDIDAEYPSLTFEPVRALNDEEYEEVERHLSAEVTDRILNTAVDHVQTDSVPPQGAIAGPASQTVQKPQEPPAGFKPHVVAGTAAQPQAPAPVPAATTPAAASVQRVAEVEQKQTGDPKAAQRAAMRSMGLDEEAIVRALGPEPKAEEPPDPRIAQMKALGLTDEQIKAALGFAPGGNSQANGAAPAQAPAKRTRRTKAEIEAAKAAEQKPQEPSQEPTKDQEDPFSAGPVQPLNGEVLDPEEGEEATSDEPDASALPSGFESKLEFLLGKK